MTIGSIDLLSVLAGIWLISSVVALVLVVLNILRTQAWFDDTVGRIAHTLETLESRSGFARDLQEVGRVTDGLHEYISSRLAFLKGSQRSENTSSVSAEQSVYVGFLDLVDEWIRMTAIDLLGAAAENKQEIEHLARMDKRSGDAAARNDHFAECANRLAEYMVQGTDAKFKRRVPDDVDAVLRRIVQAAHREFINPPIGTAWDHSLHDFVDKEPRGSNRPATIAFVSVRGLKGGSAKVMKAKVFLYDD